MADYDQLTYFHLQGLYDGITGDTTGVYGDAGYEPDMFAVNMSATIIYGVPGPEGQMVTAPPELRIAAANPPRTLLLVPVAAQVLSGVLQLPGQDTGVAGVDLVAMSPMLGLDTLLCQVKFGPASIGGMSFQFDPVTFVVPTVQQSDYHANVVQTVTLNGAPDGGHYNLTYANDPTMNLPNNSTAATIKTALNNIPEIGGAVLSVVVASGGADGSGPYVVTFDTTKIARPQRLGTMSALTSSANSFPTVTVTDAYQPVTVDLTTVDRWAPAA